MLERLSEMTAPPSSRLDADVFDLGRWIVSINEQLREWRQAYVFADNAPEVFHAVDEHVPVSELVTAAQTAAVLLARWCG